MNQEETPASEDKPVFPSRGRSQKVRPGGRETAGSTFYAVRGPDGRFQTQPPGGGRLLLIGQDHLEQLKADGFIGLWKDRTDIGDSTEFARRLRESAEDRADRYDQEEPAA